MDIDETATTVRTPGTASLADRLAIEDVLVRYATAIDRRDWDLFATCFVSDVRTDYGDVGAFDGIESLTAFMVDAHAGFGTTNHLLSNFVIAVDGDRATACSYVHVVLVFADGSASIDGVGRYEDDLVRTVDGWRLTSRRYLSTRSVVLRSERSGR